MALKHRESTHMLCTPPKALCIPRFALVFCPVSMTKSRLRFLKALECSQNARIHS